MVNKGRNPHLIQKRNQYLVKRYYYWYDVKRLRRDDVLELLENEEVFLDKDYINTLLLQNSNLLDAIRAARPKPERLRDFKFNPAGGQLTLNLS